MAYWNQFFKDHPVPPLDFSLYFERLKNGQRIKDCEAAILAYLGHRPKAARPQSWMYKELAIAMYLNRKDAVTPADTARIKDALGYAAILAQQDGNPNFLLSTVGVMRDFGYDELTVTSGGKPIRVTVGALLDDVARKVPHRHEPLQASLDLARRTLDPKRMADSAEKLLALGWPGVDDGIRAEVRRQVDDLAGDLQAANRQAEADDLQARLATALGRDLFVRLTWEGDADLDLIVDEPFGVSASHFVPRTVFGGALIKEGRGKDREEVYVCPRAFDGDYALRVQAVYQDPDKPPVTSATLEFITREGLPGEHKEARVVRLQAAEPVVVRDDHGKVVRGKDGKPETLPSPKPPKSLPVVVHLTGGRRKLVLPFNGGPPAPAAIVVMPPDPTPEDLARAKARAEKQAEYEARFRAQQAEADRSAPAPAIGNRGTNRPPRTTIAP